MFVSNSMTLFCAKSDSHGDKLRRRGQFVTAQEVISVRERKINRRASRDVSDERDWSGAGQRL